MENKKLTLDCQHGTIEGLYYNAGGNSPIILIVNGHNGFYNYGMFPFIQQKFFENGISSYSFNFSHGGVNGDSDIFEDLEKYEKNCMRLETQDLNCVLGNVGAGRFGKPSNIFLFAHSLGGVPALFSAGNPINEKIKIRGIILVSTVMKLDFWPREIIEEWKEKKILYRKNHRTNQELPQGHELLQEVLQSHTKWNVEKKIRSLQIPILIIHGQNDEAVSVDHAYRLFSSAKEINPEVSLKIIQDATHTYNTKHPFQNSTPQLEDLILTSVTWIKKINDIKKPDKNRQA